MHDWHSNKVDLFNENETDCLFNLSMKEALLYAFTCTETQFSSMLNDSRSTSGHPESVGCFDRSGPHGKQVTFRRCRGRYFL